jgi:phosphoribosyl 1,2-cyclic phosphodiesterase
MRVRFFGVRGSLPVPGRRTERYGGNTSCVEVVTDAGTRIVIDAGTGIRKLGKELMPAEREAGGKETHILVSHTHWDHIQGLPFFAPLYHAGSRLVVHAQQRNGGPLRSVLHSQSEAPYFPVAPHQVKAEVVFRELPEGARFEIHDARVESARLNHPYVATAYAVVADGAGWPTSRTPRPSSTSCSARSSCPARPPATCPRPRARPCGRCARRW